MTSSKIKAEHIVGILPFLAFLILYVSVGVYYSYLGDSQAFSRFPAPASALLAFGFALLLGYKKLNQTINTFAAGIADNTVILMSLVFLLAGAFSAVSQGMGGVESTVNLGLNLLPSSLLLPSLFIIACFVSLAMGTSMGTIGAIVPIALGIALKADISPAFAVGTVLGGAMFGDNLSIISDTTIAATGTQGCSMRDKMLANLPIAIPAAVLTCLILFFWGSGQPIQDNLDFNLIKTLPYLLVIILSIMGLHVLAVLMLGIVLSGLIGLLTDSLSFVQFGQSIYAGFLGMADVFFLTFLIAGLAALAVKAGTIEALVNKFHKRIKSKRAAEFAISSIASVADIAVANNTIALIVSGNICKKISNDFGLNSPRVASLMDIFTCVFQGLLPYAPQMLLAAGLSMLSPFQILPYVWYPVILGFFALISIVFKKHN